MNRNTIQKILIGFFFLACIFIGLKTFNVVGTKDNSSRTELKTNIRKDRIRRNKKSKLTLFLFN